MTHLPLTKQASIAHSQDSGRHASATDTTRKEINASIAVLVHTRPQNVAGKPRATLANALEMSKIYKSCEGPPENARENLQQRHTSKDNQEGGPLLRLSIHRTTIHDAAEDIFGNLRREKSIPFTNQVCQLEGHP